MSIQGYDQWKTASPGDDEPDWIELAEKFIKRLDKQVEFYRNPLTETEGNAREIISRLLEYIGDNT